ncbi:MULTISPECIES: phage tail protein [Streptomyces]|uniref:phage tail tube protein n=1 Tax=Streptomyces TaxID=1883 RepID=UPI0009393687|nr:MULTISPECIES: phage tail protein [Streptomyces]MBX9423490.1 phage tail protein [Streptomyces lateritius]OKJ68119.1 phage tail protein [Streptomyces sp. CB02261]
MAGNNSAEIRVAGTGKLYVANAGADAPTTFGADTAADWTGAGWKDLGFTTGDGVTFAKKDKLEPIDSWQSVSPVHFIYSSRDLSLKFSMLQFNELTLPFFMGGGKVEAEPASSTETYKYEIAERPFADVRALGLEFTDVKAGGTTAVTYRFIIPRGQVTASDDIKLARKAASQLGVTFTAMSQGDGKPLATFLMKDSQYGATV